MKYNFHWQVAIQGLWLHEEQQGKVMWVMMGMGRAKGITGPRHEHL